MKKNTTIVYSIVHQIWKTTNRLRYSYPNNEPHILLFLISAFKDRILEDLDFESNIYDQLKDVTKKDSFYNEIFCVYAAIIENLPRHHFQEMLSSLNNVKRHQLEENFKDVFEHLLKKITAFKGKESGESFQPIEITRLVIALADLPKKASIYNPFAGYASYGVPLNDLKNYYGQEINDCNWAIGKLRLRAHNKNYSFEYKVGDSINKWDKSQKFDLIVSTPPFKLTIPRDFHANLTGEGIRDVQTFVVDRGLYSLTNKGKLITVFPESFLFKRTGRFANFKKNLIDHHLIDTIISLPSGLFSNTSIPVCIIVFSQVQRRPGFIRFIQGSDFFSNLDSTNKVLDIEKIESLIDNDLENEFLKYVNEEEIYKNEFNLSVSRYFLENINGKRLIDFASIISGPIAPVGQKMKQVQIKELKDDVIDCELDSENIKPKIVNKGTFKVIEESCLLIATLGNSVKPTFFKYKGEAICISGALLALRIDQKIINPVFLINEFSSQYVIDQLEAFRIGTFQPMLPRRDLNNLVFKLPPMQEQIAKVSAVNELSKKIQKIELEKQNLLHGIQKEETESSTSLSHVLGKPLLSIGSSIEIIQTALSTISPDWRNHMISQNRGFTIKDAFDSISTNIKYIQELADRNTSLINVSKFELNTLELLKLLKEFVKHEKQSLPANVKINLDIHEDIRDHYRNKINIKGNHQKLRIVLVNLLDNAKTHAFIDNKKNQAIKIEVFPFTGGKEEAAFYNYSIDENKSYVRIRFLNSGLPFPKDMTLDDYKRKHFTSGKKGNRGLGGYEINEILKAHNEGKDVLDIVTNYQGEGNYTSEVSFIIPIIENYE